MPWQQKYACLGLGLDIGFTLFGSVITEYFPRFRRTFRILQWECEADNSTLDHRG